MPGLRSFLNKLGGESGSFVGIFQCGEERSGLLLFIFQGEPYAAAVYNEGEFRTLPLDQFPKESERLGRKGVLYATNPVLFKLILVVTQCQPSVVGNGKVINLESLLESLEKGGKEQVLLLKRGGELNLFYFRGGKLADGYFSDPNRGTRDAAGLSEALLIYAFEPGPPLEIRVYEDLQIDRSNESSPIPPAESEPALAVLQIQLGNRWIEKGVDKEVFILGRGIQSDCVVDDSSVSREIVDDAVALDA
ncbi:MAG TPA: hypothetical protein VFG95_08445, partial [Nitrospiria bacterium]|nr:hypothetical protein [Nitrospiria bacterium]